MKELTKEQKDLLDNMSKDTIRYFAAIMHAFEIPNYFEATAISEDYRYVLRIDKKKV